MYSSSAYRSYQTWPLPSRVPPVQPLSASQNLSITVSLGPRNVFQNKAFRVCAGNNNTSKHSNNIQWNDPPKNDVVEVGPENFLPTGRAEPIASRSLKQFGDKKMRPPVWACGPCATHKQARDWLLQTHRLHLDRPVPFHTKVSFKICHVRQVLLLSFSLFLSHTLSLPLSRQTVHSPSLICHGYGRKPSCASRITHRSQRICPENELVRLGCCCGKARGGRGGKQGPRPTSVDENIVSSQLEETGDVLEHKGERVRLPIIGVIGELDSSLNVYWLPD